MPDVRITVDGEVVEADARRVKRLRVLVRSK